MVIGIERTRPFTGLITGPTPTIIVHIITTPVG